MKTQNKTWFDIRNGRKKSDPTEVLIYDEIGLWGVSAKDFVTELKNSKARNINLRINSPGGNVFDGLAIHNYLKTLDNVNVFVDGIAASIASVIAMAGHMITVASNGFMMIHNPAGVVVGESEDMRKLADDLDRIKAALVRTYTARTGQSEEQVTEWMDETTWFTASEAKENGFADEVGEELAFQANMNALHRFGEVPKAIGGDTPPPKNETKNPEQKENSMTKLLLVMATAGAIKSADADEATAIAEFKDWLKANNAEAKKQADALKAEQDKNKDIQAKLDEQAKATAKAAIEAAIDSGKIKNDDALKERWTNSYISDPAGTQEMLNGMEPSKPQGGHDPLNISPGTGKSDDDKPKPVTARESWSKQFKS